MMGFTLAFFFTARHFKLQGLCQNFITDFVFGHFFLSLCFWSEPFIKLFSYFFVLIFSSRTRTPAIFILNLKRVFPGLVEFILCIDSTYFVQKFLLNLTFEDLCQNKITYLLIENILIAFCVRQFLYFLVSRLKNNCLHCCDNRTQNSNCSSTYKSPS